jgi:tetratricopeptide (TPR) repeat protein
VCRAWYAKALLLSEATVGLKGEPLVESVHAALKCLSEGLEVALGDPRYLFLVYDASVHYWKISRPLQKPGTRKHLIETSSAITKALESVSGHEEWKIHNLRLHALCLSDGENHDDALKAASDAHELCKASAPSLAPLAVKLRTHVGSLSGKKEAEGDGVEGAITTLQLARSGMFSDPEALKEALMEAWKKVDPAAELLGEAKDESSNGADFEVVAEIGWVAAQNGLVELATWCSQRAPGTRSELTSNLNALNGLEDKRGTLAPVALQVHKDVANSAAQVLAAFVRLQDVAGIQDACQLMWMASLPLQQPEQRHRLTRIFAAAVKALEAVSSSMNRLRTALHLELAYCYLAEHMVVEANVQVSKALALDYVSPAEEVELTEYERPLDRFLVPLARVLALKGSLYEDPEGVEDQALQLAEQARDAKTLKVKSDLLQRAVAKLVMLDPLPPPTEEFEGDAGEKKLLRRAAKARATVWGTIAKVAMEAKMTSLVHQVAVHVLEITGWDPVRDKDMILLQVEVNFIDGLACTDILASKGLQSVPPKTIETEGEFIGDTIDELQNTATSAFIKAARLGATVSESWAVMNAASHVWNNYIALTKSHRYAELLPATDPLFAELFKLEDCDPSLLGNFAHLVSSGYEHAALLTVGDVDTAEEERVTDYKTLLEMHASHTFEVSDEINKGIETCKSVLARVDDKNKHRLSAMQARLQVRLGAALDVKVEDDPVAQVWAMIEQVAQPGKEPAAAGEIVSQAMSLLRPEDSEVAGDLEVWARLGDAAYNAKAYGPAIESCKQAVELAAKLDPDAPSQMWYWAGVAECAYGNGIVALIRPEVQDQTAQDALKQKAVEHFVEASKHGRHALRSDIVYYAARCFWNTATGFMTTAATRSTIAEPLETILDACRATKVNDFRFMQSMFLLLFDCLEDKSSWAEGARQIEAAFSFLPDTEHQPLWEYKVLFMTVMGESVIDELSKITKYDEEMQAKVWATVAAQAKDPVDALKAHKKAIHVLDNQPWIKVDFMIDFAEWIDASGQSASDAEDVLLSAMDILLEIDNGGTEDGDGLFETSRSFSSNTGRSIPATPEASMKSLGSSTKFVSSGTQLRTTLRASDEKEGPQPPARLGTKQMRQIIRVFLMLGKLSGNNFERSDHLLMAQHYALRMLKESIVEAVSVAESPSESVEVSIPETLEEWATFQLSEGLLAQIQKNTGALEMSMDSIGRPELFLAHLEYLCAGLESSSRHLHCLSVWQLGVLVAKVVAKNDSLVTVSHLRLASVSDVLLLSSAAVMHEDLAGNLEITAEELAQGREEVKQRERLQQPSTLTSRAPRITSRRGTPELQSTADSSKLLRPFALRDYWLARGAYLVKRGALAAATVLLQEAIGHAHAHDDPEVEAKAYFHLAKCAAYGNKPVDAIKLQHRGQVCGGDVVFWGENLADYTKYKLSTRNGKLSAKESLTTALKILRGRLRISSRGSTLDSNQVMANLLIELCHVMEADVVDANATEGNATEQYSHAMKAITEAISILHECGGGGDLVKALMTKVTLMYKEPSVSGDPRPRLENIKTVIREAEVEAERLFTAACTGSLNPLSTSLPAARVLAAVKNARADCLLEIAHAAKAHEAQDKEKNRPAFPSFQGTDASAVRAFLDEITPETFSSVLGPIEEAVVAASEASNLHKNSSSIDSLHVLGEALIASYNIQTRGKVWIEPPAPPVPPVEGEEDEKAEENAESGQGDQAEGEPDGAGAKDAESGEGKIVDQSEVGSEKDFEAQSVAPEEDKIAQPELGPDLMKPRAIRVLEQAIELGLKSGKYSIVSKAATHLACAYGSTDHVNAAASLALAQSCRVVEAHLSLFKSAAGEQDVESLIIQNQKTMDETLSDSSSSKYSKSLMERLQSSCKAWRRLSIKPEQCLTTPPALPEGLIVFSVQWLVGRGGENSLAITCHSDKDGESGAYVARADLTQLLAATELVTNYRAALEKELSEVVHPKEHDAVFATLSVQAGWGEVCKATEWLLAPILNAWKSFLGADGAVGRKIVILLDEVLAALPVEALEVLNGADSVSRDFSLHVLLQRIAETKGQSAIPATEMTYMVDLRYEEAPGAALEAGAEEDAEATSPSLTTRFEELKSQFGSNWSGVMGSLDGIPGEGECQRAMIGAKSLLYYGHGRFLSYVPPSAIACVDLSACRLAILAGNSVNEASHKKQDRLDGRKTQEELALENPYKTAALLSLRGVNTVVVPTYSCTAAGNAKTLASVLSARGTEDVVDISTAVWKSSDPDPEEEAEAAAEGEAGEEGEVADEASGPPFSKFNFVVYGLPSVSFA